MRAYATPPLVKAVRQEGADIKVNDAVEIESVLYLLRLHQVVPRQLEATPA